MTSPDEELGYPAYRCPWCHSQGSWYLQRIGDAVVSWSCDSHLPLVLDSLQRDSDRNGTEIMVTRR